MSEQQTKYWVNINDSESGEATHHDMDSLKELLDFRDRCLNDDSDQAAEFRAFNKCKFYIMIGIKTYEL